MTPAYEAGARATRERVARAMFEEGMRGHKRAPQWDEDDGSSHEYWYRLADAAIRALPLPATEAGEDDPRFRDGALAMQRKIVRELRDADNAEMDAAADFVSATLPPSSYDSVRVDPPARVAEGEPTWGPLAEPFRQQRIAEAAIWKRAEDKRNAERRVIEAAQQYIAFVRQHQAAPVVAPGLTPTYASLLSRLGAACDALGAVQDVPPPARCPRCGRPSYERGGYCVCGPTEAGA